MACGYCKDCGTGLEKNGVCPNCDEAAFINDWQGEYIQNPSSDFSKEVADGYDRARKRTEARDVY